MAKRKSNKRLEELTNKLKSQTDKSSSLEERINLLESELRDSLVLISSMIEVNKELLARQKSDSSTPTDDSPVSDKDSTNTILKKIYTFFVKGSERDKRNYELQRDREQEQIMESRRRKSSRKATATKIDPKKPSSNPIMDLLGFVGSGIAGIFTFITGGLFGIISKGIGSIVGIIQWITKRIPVIGGAVSSVIGGVASTVGSVFSAFGGLAGFLKDIITPLVYTIVTGIVSGMATIISSAFGVLMSSIGIGKKVTTAILTQLGPPGMLAALGLATADTISAISDINNSVEGLIYGKDIIDNSDEIKRTQDIIDSKGFSEEEMRLNKPLTTKEQEKRVQGATEERSKAIKKRNELILKRYDELGKILSKDGWEKVTINNRSSYDILRGIVPDVGGFGFAKRGPDGKLGEPIQFALTTRNDLNEKVYEPDTGGINQLNDKATLAMAAGSEKIGKYISSTATDFAEKMESTYNRALNTPISDLASGNLSTSPTPSATPSTPITSTPTPSATPVAPSEQPEQDSVELNRDVTTPPTTPISSSTIPSSIPSLMDSDYMESGEVTVINNTSNSSVSNEESDYGGTPNVRNPNPIVYRTAMFNDQALAGL